MGTFRELLEEVKEDMVKVLDFQDIPFDYLVEKLVKERDVAVRPFFQVMMNIPPSTQNRVDVKKQDLSVQGSDLSMTSFPVDMVEEEHFDLTWTFSDEDEYHSNYIFGRYF